MEAVTQRSQSDVDTAIADLRALGRHAEADTFALSLAASVEGLSAKGKARIDPLKPTTGVSLLSTAERKVADLLMLGQSNKAIAIQTGISQRTVETRVTRLLRKLEVDSRLQVALVLQAQSG